MRLKVLWPAFAGVLAITSLSAQGVRIDYDRANGLRDRVQNKVYDVIEAPVWIPGSAAFWYRKTVKGGNEFVLADPTIPAKSPPFDHARLASSLSAAAGATYTAFTPFSTFTFADNRQATSSAAAAPRLDAGEAGAPRRGRAAVNAVQECTLADSYQCASRRPPAQAAGGRMVPVRQWTWRRSCANAATPTRPSPDNSSKCSCTTSTVFTVCRRIGRRRGR